MATKKGLNMKGIVGNVMAGVTGAGGGVAGALVDRIVPGSINPKLVQGGKILIGAILPEVIKGQVVERLSLGFCGQAGGKLFESFVPAKVTGGEEVIGADTSYSIEEDVAEVSGREGMENEIDGIITGVSEDVTFE